MISILLATYNGASYIEEMLDSLYNQTFKDFCCYIHDDGSSDETVSIIKDWIALKGREDNRFEILEGPATGSSKANFMWMLAQVESDYYMFADQDDVWLPTKVADTFEAFDSIETDEARAAFCDMYVTDRDLNVTSDSFISHIGREPSDLRYQRIMIDNPAAGCTMLINKRLRDIAIRLEDLDLIKVHDGYILALASLVGEVVYLDEPLVLYRQHGNNEMGAEVESVTSKARRNATDIISARASNNKRAFHMNEINLAKALLSVVEEGECAPEDIYTLKQLSSIDKKGKLSRIKFYKSNGFDRAKNNGWFLLWV